MAMGTRSSAAERGPDTSPSFIACNSFGSLSNYHAYLFLQDTKHCSYAQSTEPRLVLKLLHMMAQIGKAHPGEVALSTLFKSCMSPTDMCGKMPRKAVQDEQYLLFGGKTSSDKMCAST